MSELFQFHKGSIKTVYGNEGNMQSSPFQFHKGSIKTLLSVLLHLLI